jgi:hypothetical protein
LVAATPGMDPPKEKVRNSRDYPEGSPEYEIVQKRLRARQAKQLVGRERHQARFQARHSFNVERGFVPPVPVAGLPSSAPVAAAGTPPAAAPVPPFPTLPPATAGAPSSVGPVMASTSAQHDDMEI